MFRIERDRGAPQIISPIGSDLKLDADGVSARVITLALNGGRAIVDARANALPHDYEVAVRIERDRGEDLISSRIGINLKLCTIHAI